MGTGTAVLLGVLFDDVVAEVLAQMASWSRYAPWLTILMIGLFIGYGWQRGRLRRAGRSTRPRKRSRAYGTRVSRPAGPRAQ